MYIEHFEKNTQFRTPKDQQEDVKKSEKKTKFWMPNHITRYDMMIKGETNKKLTKLAQQFWLKFCGYKHARKTGHN